MVYSRLSHSSGRVYGTLNINKHTITISNNKIINIHVYLQSIYLYIYIYKFILISKII